MGAQLDGGFVYLATACTLSNDDDDEWTRQLHALGRGLHFAGHRPEQTPDDRGTVRDQLEAPFRDEYRLPAGVRHANTVRVTQAELDALIAHYA